MRASELKAKPGPSCFYCGEAMWWMGSTTGWGCPKNEGKPYRNKMGFCKDAERCYQAERGSQTQRMSRPSVSGPSLR
jgi:hypothetical protein